MLEDDYFARKKQQLGLDRADVLGAIQKTLDTWYPGQARAKQLHAGVLRIVTPNASVASDLRLRQIELTRLHSLQNTRLSLSVSSLS
jgi:hypothetical protein